MIRQMTLVPKREYVVLLAGDALIFVISLWLTLVLRYLAVPGRDFFMQHVAPFSILFIAWTVVFFIAGLYGKHTRLFRHRLPSVILYTQAINIAIAALFFFLIPLFGIAPKTILLLYLAVSCPLIYFWRVSIFPRLRASRRLRGVLIASGSDVHDLSKEIAGDSRYPFEFVSIIDTQKAKSHDVVQEACRVAAQSSTNFFVVDFSDKAISTALPIVYNSAFQDRRFALVDAVDLYQEVFDRMPLSLLQYERVLAGTSSSRIYDFSKRIVDILGALVIGIFALIVYPFVGLAIKLEDGGPIFITQPRVGKYQKPIRIIKFRSMSGNDDGAYGKSGKTELHVTKVGYWIRLLRIDELPQLWNVLIGELSLVGPRPELPALSARYSARIPYYDARYLINPGLTGWAQIKHDRDPHHGADIPETKAKLSYDLFYLEKRSLLLDVYIILQTIRIVISARGS
jgi:lipopolysaccharide/colanic/teichoic acid biosynthesis glycosyltransferase